jgi:hypothetical protein
MKSCNRPHILGVTGLEGPDRICVAKTVRDTGLLVPREVLPGSRTGSGSFGIGHQALESLDLPFCVLLAHHGCAMKRRTTTDLVRHRSVLDSDLKVEFTQ